jgi:ATP-dependent Lon protease
MKSNNKRSPKSDDGSSSESGSDEEDMQIMDQKQYRKFLNSLFPSKYMENKVKQDAKKDKSDKSDKNKKNDKKEKTRKSISQKDDKKEKKGKKDNKKKSDKKDMVDIVFTILPNKKKGFSEEDEDDEDMFEEEEYYEVMSSSEEDDDDSSEDEDSDEEDSDYEDEEDEEEDEDEEDEDQDEDDEDEEDEEHEEEDEDEEEEDEEEEVTVKKASRKRKRTYNTRSSKNDNNTKENKKRRVLAETDEDEEHETTETSSNDGSDATSSSEQNDVIGKKANTMTKNRKDSKTTNNLVTSTSNEDDDIYSKIQTFKQEIKKKYKNEKEVLQQFKQFEQKINKQKSKVEKGKKRKNLKKYMELISNKSLISDIKFFKETLNPREQENVLKQLEEIKSMTKIDKPYRIQLLENKDIPNEFKAVALKKINALKIIADGGGEYSKLKNWIDTFMRIPFNKIQHLPVNKNDPIEKVHDFIDKSKNILDEAVYGMKDAKVQLMQMVAQWVANPNAIGNAIAIKGPMGTGKTTLVKYGVSKLLNREFAFIPLGGATDSSYLEGHSYTYEGSTYGKIVDILIQCKSSNPVIYFDELDKVSDTPKGEEIIGILTHLTDTTQNDKFHDKYFSEIDFDLSKCLFIFSYNDENKINPILKDRMYNIETRGYDFKDKIVICNKYLIPKLENELDMVSGSIQFSDDIIQYIVEKYTNEEKGVRNLKRCLEVIYSKLNLYKFMKPGTDLFGDTIIENIEFPYTMNKEMVDKIISKPQSKGNGGALSMYL